MKHGMASDLEIACERAWVRVGKAEWNAMSARAQSDAINAELAAIEAARLAGQHAEADREGNIAFVKRVAERMEDDARQAIEMKVEVDAMTVSRVLAVQNPPAAETGKLAGTTEDALGTRRGPRRGME